VNFGGQVKFIGGAEADLAVKKKVRVKGTLSDDEKVLTAQSIEFVAAEAP
jgi:hypothetical protein